ncbi:MAG: KamA family radical SAM protein [Desulfobulbaceae bacterium]|uniref:L-lysine 2,3-aminomutase n=1 Tax=Candidatus Desulfobia pelagia TaxID=2841692 RepID=A0A8J6TGQ7_9BACT|nr:KamA family radical SAM protein [Candidatus Desulfobia pelagia]
MSLTLPLDEPEEPLSYNLNVCSPSFSAATPARFTAISRAKSFRSRYFPHITIDEWNDWRWQLRNRITTTEQLEKIINLTDSERQALQRSSSTLPFAITPYYASLVSPNNPHDPVRRAVVPVVNELVVSNGEAHDPLGEDSHTPVPGLVHRYPDRVLFLLTDYCSTYCRYCTRSRMVGRNQDTTSCKERWEKAFAYIEKTTEIRDVLLSGGDPLTLPDETLEYILKRLRSIKHVELIRIGTKTPAVLPQRITSQLTRMLRRYHPVWISIHAMHPAEQTREMKKACERLADAGIPLGSQTVLLAGINDDVPTMKKLMQGLVRMRVKPYYLYQCDPIIGSAHFRTSVTKGLEIYQGLRGHTTGYAVPTYVIDAPGGGGKIPLLPETFLGRDGSDILLKNYEGNTYRYPDAL